MSKFKKSSRVQWKWLGRPVYGVVEDIFKTSITKTIKSKKITRHGTDNKPAYLVKSEAGNLALKLETELTPQTTKANSTTQPKMFKS